ncbi:MAG TPA: tryptophan transporter [Verrucomicrobiae bacterium]|nr:tryptophan transporter [Verrucomicrobiae bacterium]
MNNELQVSGHKKSNLTSLIVIAVLIGIGAALRVFAPPIFGITPNFVIAMYCLAILLTRPKLGGALAIGLVGGIVSMLTSKSAVPYINLLSEPTGALVCFLVANALSNAKISKLLLRPVLATFLGTVASGGLFVFITKVILVWKVAAAASAFGLVVIPTALANTVIAYALYLPTQKVLKLEAK